MVFKNIHFSWKKWLITPLSHLKVQLLYVAIDLRWMTIYGTWKCIQSHVLCACRVLNIHVHPDLGKYLFLLVLYRRKYLPLCGLHIMGMSNLQKSFWPVGHRLTWQDEWDNFEVVINNSYSFFIMFKYSSIYRSTSHIVMLVVFYLYFCAETV